MQMPNSAAITSDLEWISDEQVRELAVAYLDLLRLMTEALEVCEQDWAFFQWSGQGFNITGHPPTELIELLKGATR